MRIHIIIAISVMILAPVTTISLPMHLPSQSYQNQSHPWADSFNGKSVNNPSGFSFIGNVQKFLDNRNIGIGFESNRYELFYKKIY
ncbi:hypothetical protein [Lucifera butyrica]|uniref:hypothetical protein n=1 Tax=Lucifera butyrica TaxID=1351585 RepID=UPI000F03C1D4|nr:hypothetical protein [Lucifera butyrica]